MNAADNHRRVAGNFTTIVAGTRDWDAPTPVAEWKARDVVEHLLGWLPSVLQDWAGVTLIEHAGDDLLTRWRARTEEIQQLLQDPETADRRVTTDMTAFAGRTVAEVIDQIYTSDIYQHTWDLATSSGQNPNMDPETARRMLGGMQQIEEILRSSGQYGPAVPTDSTEPVDQLVGFIGRDPSWKPARSRT